MFMGTSEASAGDLGTATDCRLGKWYYEGEGKTCFSQLDGYRTLEGPHLEIHRQGRMAVESYRAGNISAGLDAVEQMEAASTNVLQCLERMALDGAAKPDVLFLQR